MVELRKIILTLIISLSLGIPIAYATSDATLHLDLVSGGMKEGSMVTFSGQLTSFNGTAIPHRTIFIEDDTSYDVRPDIIIAITKTDSDGKFLVSWKAVPKDNGNSFHFYAKYLGGNYFGYTRSETYESIIEHVNQSSIGMVPSKTIPIWFKNASKMWHDGQIRDVDYSWGIKNLMEHGVIKSNITSDIEFKLPVWLKNDANWFAEDDISKEEYANSLQYLLENKIIY
jgi:hypothetical protein